MTQSSSVRFVTEQTLSQIIEVEGVQGPPGVGVPEGGAPLQVVRKSAAGVATEWATPTKSMVGLSQVDNTSDARKPVSEAQANALGGKVGKGELVINVKDYGAKGNGVADDTLAIQAAEAAADAGYTRPLYVPNGTYLFSHTMTAKTVIGENRQKTLLKYTGSGDAVGPGVGVQYHRRWAHLSLQGSGAGTGLNLDTSPAGSYINMIVQGFTTGINLDGTGASDSLYNVFDDVTVQTTTTGVRIDGLSHENRFKNFRINYATTGFDFISGGRNVIESAAIENTTTGVRIRDDGSGKNNTRANVIAHTRFEFNTTNYQIDAGVQMTGLLFNRYVGGQGVDNGTYTMNVDITTGTYKGTAARLEQKSPTATADALKVINGSAQAYALKVDQTGAGHDAVNIASLSGGGHTALGVLASNTSLSTTKITNNASQTGGAVVAALGTDPTRTAGIFNGENSGSGGTYISTMSPTGTGAAFQAVYDPSVTYGSRSIWVRASHAAGDLMYIENAQAQTSGSSMKVVQSNAGTTAPILNISNAGSGDHIIADNFGVQKAGNVKANSIFNHASFANARLQLGVAGSTIDRNVADNSPTLKINNINAGSTGDIAQFQAASAVKARVTGEGHFAIRTNAAPADATLVAGEASFWVDSTNGSAKLMVKAKQADGTVKTGSIALA